MGKSIISMVIFNSYVTNSQRVDIGIIGGVELHLGPIGFDPFPTSSALDSTT